MNWFEIIAVGGGVLIAVAVVAAYRNTREVVVPTIDEVMADPAQWHRDGSWDSGVAIAVHEAAHDRTHEICPSPRGFMRVLIEQEDAIWDILNKKLAEEKVKCAR